MTSQTPQFHDDSFQAPSVIFVVEPNGTIHRDTLTSPIGPRQHQQSTVAKRVACLVTVLLLCAGFVWWIGRANRHAVATTLLSLPDPTIADSNPAIKAPLRESTKPKKFAIGNADDQRQESNFIPITWPVWNQAFHAELSVVLQNRKPRDPPASGASAPRDPKPPDSPISPTSAAEIASAARQNDLSRRIAGRTTAIAKIAQALQGGAVSTPIERLVPCLPGIDEVDWSFLPVIERVRHSYIAMERAVPESGEFFLAKLVKAINGYESSRFDAELSGLLDRLDSIPKDFTPRFELPDIPEPTNPLSAADQKFLDQFEQFARRRVIGGPFIVIQRYFLMSPSEIAMRLIECRTLAKLLEIQLAEMEPTQRSTWTRLVSQDVNLICTGKLPSDVGTYILVTEKPPTPNPAPSFPQPDLGTPGLGKSLPFPPVPPSPFPLPPGTPPLRIPFSAPIPPPTPVQSLPVPRIGR